MPQAKTGGKHAFVIRIIFITLHFTLTHSSRTFCTLVKPQSELVDLTQLQPDFTRKNGDTCLIFGSSIDGFCDVSEGCFKDTLGQEESVQDSLSILPVNIYTKFQPSP